MPIHDQGYRRYGGTRARAGRAWAVIAQAGVRARLLVSEKLKDKRPVIAADRAVPADLGWLWLPVPEAEIVGEAAAPV